MTEPASDSAASASATPPPVNPGDTGGLSKVLFPQTPATVPGTVMDITTLASRPMEDLSSEQLLRSTPRMNLGERLAPALGGIPLLAKLGQGGMGAVYYGVHPRLHLEVAVKVLAPHLSFQSPSMVERFFREARTAARVKSPHLVAVLDVNEEQGLYYLVMEFVRGISAGGLLKETLARGAGGLSEADALDICMAATQGLVAAHEEGIIHRDIKPDNILIPQSKDGQVLRFAESKLADLGLARGEQSEQGLTASQVALGTPGFMAPEQALDTRLTAKPADIFSLGATLYSLLAGRAPFTGTSLIKVLMATAHEAHAPIATIRPDLSPQTAALVDRCLSKEPEARHPDAVSLLEALRACRTSLNPSMHGTVPPTLIHAKTGPVSAPSPSPTTPSAGATWTPASASTTPVPSTPSAPRRSRWVTILVILLLLILVAAGIGGRLFIKDRKERKAVATVVQELEPARKADDQTLNAAIARLEEFRRDFTGRDALLTPATELLADLQDRKEQLASRKVEFAKLIAQARERVNDRPQEALDVLERAEDLGEADTEKAWPDLNANCKDECTALRRQAEERLAMLAATADAAQRRQDFAIAYQAGAGHLSRGENEQAVQVLTQALERLGDLDHVARGDATGLLEKARKELKRREWAASQMIQADQSLKAGQLEEAAVLYRQARETWPENPDNKRVEAGLAAVTQQLHARHIAEGRKALVARDWPAAERAFLAALKDTPGDASATAGLQEARSHSQDSRYSQAMEDGYRALQQQQWDAANKAFQRALELRKDDPAAIQGLQDAQGRSREDLVKGLLASGQQALTQQAWGRATACYQEALRLKRGDPTALQGLQRATLQSVGHFSFTRLMEGYAKVKGMRDRAEAQLGPLARQVEQDRAEVERLSRETKPGGRKRVFEHLRNLKQLTEARERLNRDMLTLKEESDRVRLAGMREVLGDVVAASTEFARRKPYQLVLQFESAAGVTAQNFQRLADYERAVTPDQMLASFKANAIVSAPQGFNPASALVPGADLGNALATSEDITNQLIQALNEAYRDGRKSR